MGMIWIDIAWREIDKSIYRYSDILHMHIQFVEV